MIFSFLGSLIGTFFGNRICTYPGCSADAVRDPDGAPMCLQHTIAVKYGVKPDVVIKEIGCPIQN